MTTDENGLTVSGANAAALADYEKAADELLCYLGDPVSSVGRALVQSPGFTMAHYLQAWLYLVGSECSGLAMARTALEAAAPLAHNPREAAHREAITAVATGRIDAAQDSLESLLVQHPRDLLALQVAHLFDFYRGDARNLRDRPARVLHAWSRQDRRYHALRGMQAFGLEECNLYDEAEQLGREALALNPRDCWAHHAVTHVFEMRGRTEDGITWMRERQPQWADNSFFAIHHWWHWALFHLELDQIEPVLALYDQRLRGTASVLVLDLVDASALLWRLKLRGVDVGPRWAALADAWAPFAVDDNYAFNSFHALMAFVGAHRWDLVQTVIENLSRQAQGVGVSAGSNQAMARDVGLPASQGLLAFARADYLGAVQHLLPVRQLAHRFGGSHAQRDVIELTLIEAAQRSGQWALLRALASERLSHKANSPLSRRYQQSASQQLTVT